MVNPAPKLTARGPPMQNLHPVCGGSIEVSFYTGDIYCLKTFPLYTSDLTRLLAKA